MAVSSPVSCSLRNSRTSGSPCIEGAPSHQKGGMPGSGIVASSQLGRPARARLVRVAPAPHNPGPDHPRRSETMESMGQSEHREGELAQLPPGQRLQRGWPVTHYGPVPKFRPDRWEFRVFGATADGEKQCWTHEEV